MNFKKKISLFACTLIFVFLIPNIDVYATSIKVNSLNVSKQSAKVGNTVAINASATESKNSLYQFSIYDGAKWYILQSYSTKATTTWKPTIAGTYKVRVDVKELNSLRDSDDSLETSFTITNPIQVQSLSKNKVINYVSTNLTLNGFSNSQMNLLTKPQTWNNGVWVDASKDHLQYYLNPNNFMNDNGINQFLKLNYMDGITIQDLNAALVGKGVLEGKGQAFLDAGKLYNVNPVYLVAHSLLETGNGTSKLATGILLNSIHETFGDINSKLIALNKNFKVYNVYGYGAYDSNPDLFGSEKAYSEQWFSLEEAIIGGGKYISKAYINNIIYNQNTLYKMRWDMNTLSKTPNVEYAHQYATDIGWAYKQSQIIKNIMSKMSNSTFYYEIPKFTQ